MAAKMYLEKIDVPVTKENWRQAEMMQAREDAKAAKVQSGMSSLAYSASTSARHIAPVWELLGRYMQLRTSTSTVASACLAMYAWLPPTPQMSHAEKCTVVRAVSEKVQQQFANMTTSL